MASKRSKKKSRRDLASERGTSRDRADSASAPRETYPVQVGLTTAALLLAAGTWSFWPTLQFLVGEWSRKADYSHGFLVVPIALFFAWERRRSWPGGNLRLSWLGLALVGIAIAGRVAAGALNMEFLDAWMIPLWLGGVVWALFGFQCFRWSLPPIIFLVFMIPLPFSAETWLSRPLQRIATKVSTSTLQILGQPAISEGNTIWLGEHQLEVAQACSGLRIFVAVIAMAFAFVLFSRWNWWHKLLVVIAVFPVAIIANAVRIVGTGILYEYASSEAAQKFSHDFSGWLMIPFAGLLFWLLLIYLDRLFPEVVEVDVMEVMRQAERHGARE